MKVDFEVDTQQVLMEAIRKSISQYNDPADIAIKIMLLKKGLSDLTPTDRLFNKLSVTDD